MAFRLRPGIENLPLYAAGKPIEELKRETGADPISKLASNENPLGPSAAAVAAIAWAAATSHRYPDAAAYQLRQAIGERIGLAPSQIVAGNGSDELIQVIALSLLGAGDGSVIPHPSFPRYEAATLIAGGATTRVPLTAAYEIDPQAVLDTVDSSTRIVWIANPNNPTGTLIKKREMDRFLERLPSDVAVVLDEAYFEFVRAEDAPNAVDYVKAGANVIGLRTLSKTYGLAGLRVGYAFCHEEFCSVLNRVRGPFNVNAIAQAAATAALKDTTYLKEAVDFNERSLMQLENILTHHGFNCTKSYANFIWADYGKPTRPLCESLLEEGVIVRGGDAFGCPTCVRVSLGTEEQLAHLDRSLGKVLAGAIA